MKHHPVVLTPLLAIRKPRRYIARCNTHGCDWTYDAGADELDARVMARVHAERAGRTVR